LRTFACAAEGFSSSREAFLGKLLFPAESDRAASDALSLFTVSLHSFVSLSTPPPPPTLCSTAVEAEGRSSFTAPVAFEEEAAGVAATATATAKALFPFDASGWFRCAADASDAVGIELCRAAAKDVEVGASATDAAAGGSALVHSVGSISFTILLLLIF